MAFFSRFIPILVCVGLLSGVVQAQSVGTVTGTVTDAASGEKLEVVQVHIPTLKLGVVSDAQGRFTIPNVPVGAHELRADLIGYATATVGYYCDGRRNRDGCVADESLRTLSGRSGGDGHGI